MITVPIIKPFPIMRAAAISLGIAGFMLLLRPFGLSIDTVVELLVVLGFVPLNFTAMLLVHAVGNSGHKLLPILRIAAIALANFCYVLALSGSGEIVSTSLKVVIVTAVVVGAVALWMRERRLTDEVIELRDHVSRPATGLIILRGEGEKDVLQVMPDALLLIRANGNYAEVCFLSQGTVKTQLLRTTLTQIAKTAPEHLLTRCHRSYLVNLGKAERLVTERGRVAIEFATGERIPVSRSFRAQVLSVLNG